MNLYNMVKKDYRKFFFCVVILASIGLFIPQNQGGLQAEYYPNIEWQGDPVVMQTEAMPALRGDDGYTLLSVNRYSVRWTGWIRLTQKGVYRFATNSDDGSYLRVAGNMLVKNGGAHGLKKVSAEMSLTEGVYPLEILYFQIGGAGVMETLWAPPGQPEQQLPRSLLFSHKPGRLAIFSRQLSRVAAPFSKILWAVSLCIGVFLGGKMLVSRFNLSLQRRHFALAALSLLAFTIAYYSPINYNNSDPYLTLLTSQAILERGTIKLDHYAEQGMELEKHSVKKNGHRYYYFPLGTPLYALPFVGLAKMGGLDMTRPRDDAFLQNLLSALSVAAALLFIYRLCRCFLNSGLSLLFSSFFVFGSSLMSTMGTALWNVNCTTLIILATLLFIVGYDRGQRQSLNPYLLGFLLFSAYLCRPTAAVFIVVIFAYTLFKDRVVFLKMALTSLGFLCLFVLFSWFEFQQLLPDYYLPSRLSQTSTFWLALYGNFFSPSRGVLIFSPYLLLTPVGILLGLKKLARQSLFWAALFWTLLHAIAISRFPGWWGGESYGSRLFTDAFPALILLTLLIWNILLRRLASHWRRLAFGMLLICGGLSIFIHSYQGLYNYYTRQWFAYPIWGLENDYMLDWKYPQFLANPDLLARRSREYQEKLLQPYNIGETIKAAFSRNAIFDGWYSAQYDTEIEQHFRWSQGRQCRIDFQIDPHEVAPEQQFILHLKIGVFEEQAFSITLNDKLLGTITQRENKPSIYTFLFDGSLLRSTNDHPPYQRLEFTISDPVAPDHGRNWAVGISIWEVRLYQKRDVRKT